MKTTNGSGAMFDGIAKRYDLLNTVTSFGFDRIWRKKAVEMLNLAEGHTILDLAAGTLDISIATLRRYRGIRVIAVDPSREMLKIGKKKIASNFAADAIHAVASTGETLPLRADSVHGAIIAFGIRNFANRQMALQQLHAAIKPGGRLVILELTIPQKGVRATLVSFYVRTIIPLFGTLLSSRSEYTYLPESMRRFPQPDEFKSELRTAGFNVIHTIPFMAGACHLYVSENPAETDRVCVQQ